MIFTIGRKLAYDVALDDPTEEHPMKLGRSENYVGGSVWKTVLQAQRYAAHKKLKGFAVYGVLADWDKDTEKSKDGPYHDLLTDSEFVRVPDEYKPKKKPA